MTVEEMYQRLKRTFEQESGETAADDGDLGLRMRVAAAELCGLSDRLDFCQKQIVPQTATGEYLAHHAQTRGLQKRTAAAASGTARFFRKTAAAQAIDVPEGTLLTSSGSGQIVYATTAPAVLDAGKLEVLVPAQAQSTGRETNLQAGKLDVLVSGLTGIDGVSNPEDFTGGMEEEDDETLRKRLLSSYLNVSNGANLRYLEELALKNSAVWSARAVADSASSNQVKLYVTDIFRKTPQSLLDAVTAQIEEYRPLNIAVTVLKPQAVTQGVTAKLYVRHLQSLQKQKGNAERFIQDEMYKLGIGEGFNPYTVARRIEATVEGFTDLEFTAPTNMVRIAQNQILTPGTIAVTMERLSAEGV